MNSEADTREWNQVILRMPELTHGRALSAFLDEAVALCASGARYVVLASVEGAGDPTRGVTQLGCACVRKEDLLKRLQYSQQLDWADFYFFIEVNDEAVRSICNELSVADAIATTVLSVRVIDDSEVHVFTPSSAAAARVTERYGASYTRTARLSMLEYPS